MLLLDSTLWLMIFFCTQMAPTLRDTKVMVMYITITMYLIGTQTLAVFNKADSVKPDPLPNYARPVLHDPSLPPVLFKLDSEYPELSNLYHIPGKLKIWGESFKSREHGYVWSKAKYHKDDALADRVLHTKSAMKVMFLGRDKIIPCDEWENSVKFEVMHELQIAAIEQCDIIRSSLLGTGKRPLKEDTDHPTWGYLKGGSNELGHLYEELRHSLAMQEVQDQQHTDANTEPDIPTSHSQRPLNPSAPSFVSDTAPATPANSDTLNVGLVFGDSTSQGVHPRIDNYVWRTAPVPGGKVCPGASEQHKKPLSHYLSSAMSGDEKDVVLQCGTNDAAACDPVIFKQGYTELVRTAASKGANVVCSSIYHRADLKSIPEVISLNTRIDILNDQIKEVARIEGATFLDNCSDVGSTPAYPNTNILSRPKYGPRYLHLRDNGKVDLAARLGNTISSDQNSQQIPSTQYQPSHGTRLNPNAATWFSQRARESHLQDEALKAKQWFDRVRQGSHYPQMSQNTAQM